MKKKRMKALAGLLTVAMCASVLAPVTVHAAGFTGWKDEDGKKCWYENDVKQGTEGRGKEIYDPVSNAWYWLDAPDGAMAVSKDVYQESDAGSWGDYVNENGVRCGKWVRYDENGHMIKGWSQDGAYYFDQTFGTMAKGYATVEGTEYFFNAANGVLESTIGTVPENGWLTIDGNQYWYENHVRQGYSVNSEYRGKEIYDPASDAWYWLDNVDGGRMAKSKDVYQESDAGSWGDYVNEDGVSCGKWVRYDENGHMIKGWSTNESGTYYFDPVYGTMAKGYAEIDNRLYYFNEGTGICEGEVEPSQYVWHCAEETTYNEDGNVWMTVSYEYDDNGEVSGRTEKAYAYPEGSGSYLYSECAYTVRNGVDVMAIGYLYDDTGRITTKSETTFTSNGDLEKDVRYEDEGEGLALFSTTTCEYDGNGNITKRTIVHEADGGGQPSSLTEWQYDANGNNIKQTQYNSGRLYYEREAEYAGENMISSKYTYYYNNGTTNSSKTEYDYDEAGNCMEERSYRDDSSLSSKTVYQYAGNTKIGTGYSYSRHTHTNLDTGEQTVTYDERLTNSSVTTYVNGRIASVDNYYGFYTIDEAGNVQYSSISGDEKAYSNGYKYEYDASGKRTAYYWYRKDDNYQKALRSYTTYGSVSLSPADVLGKSEEFIVESTYDEYNNRTSYVVETYKTYNR